jgi:hypothetical protein
MTDEPLTGGPTRAWIRTGLGVERELIALSDAYPAFYPMHMNDNGDVVGLVGERHPQYPNTFRRSDRVFLLRNSDIAPTEIGHFGSSSYVYVTNSRQVVIQMVDRSNWASTYLWQNGQLSTLSPVGAGSTVLDINANGEMLVRLQSFNSNGYALYRGGQFTSLDELGQGGETFLQGVSDSGTVFGYDRRSCGPGSASCRLDYFRADPVVIEPFVLTGTVVGNRIDLSWSVPASASPTSYRIEAASTPGGPALVAIDTGSTATSFSTDAPPGTYHVRVQARSGEQTIATSNEVVIVVVPPQACTTAPLPPTGLTATVLGHSTTLRWNPSDGATSYFLQAIFSSTLMAFSTGNTLTEYYTASPPGRYRVRLAAENSCGRSPLTPELDVIVGCTPPAAPALTANVSPGGVVSLGWDAPVGNVNTITAGSRPGATDLARFVVHGSSFTGAPAAGTYFVRLRTENVCGQVAFSPEVAVQVGAS